MSDSEKPSGQWDRRSVPAVTNRVGNWWRRLLQPAQARRTPGHNAPAGRARHPLAGPFRTGTWMVVILGILLCLPIGGIILGYILRPAAGTTGISSSTSTSGGSSDSGEKIPKPSPAKPMLPVSQAPPPTVTSPTPSPIAPVSPPQIATPQSPLPPLTTPAPSPPASAPPSPLAPKTAFAAITYPARHDKHFGGECAGQLTLNASGLYFTCPGNSGEGVQAAVNQIDAVDDNGIRLYSGKKYHFTISGMSKEAERSLFVDWLNHVR